MGDVIKDFYKSDAPQFKGRSKEKRREMAIAAKLTAERGPQNEAATEVAMSPAELALQKKKTMIDKMITMKRQQALGKTKTEEVVREGDGDPCWDTHKQVGMKKKGNRMVPNCVPKNKVKEEIEKLDEMPYQVYGSPDGKKEKKIGKPVKSKKYADARASELADTHKKTGGKYRSQYVESAEDRLRDRRMERGGVGGNQRYDRPVRGVRTLADKKKGEKKYDGMSALAKVKAELEKKHGKGSVK